MKRNKMEIHVRGNVNTFMKRILGTVEFGRLSAKLRNGNSRADSACGFGSVENSLVQVETTRNEAVVLVRKFQNC